MRFGLINPACTTKACEWLPNRKDAQPVKIEDLNFSRDDFAKRGKKRKKMLSTPKRNYNPLINNNQKTLTFLDIATALEKVTPDSVLSTALLKPKIDFVREVVSMREISTDITSIDDIILMSHSVEEFFANIKVNFSVTSIGQIQMITKGQSDNTAWFQFSKGTITTSKSHEIKTKMEKFVKGGSGYVNMWSLCQKISGLTNINPNIPALKYGRDMEQHASNAFFEIFKCSHKKPRLCNCGLFLDGEQPLVLVRVS